MSADINQIKLAEDEYEVKLYPKRGIALEKGKGSYVYDTNGKKYLDFMTNIGVNILGYTNPEITKAISEQLNTLPSTHQTFYSSKRAEFLAELTSILPPELNKIIFTNSGAESIDASLKLAITATGKNGFIAVNNAYHGKSLGSLSVTESELYKKNYMAFINKDVCHVPFNDLLAIEKSISETTAAVIVEPIQGEAGVILPDGNYLSKLKELCQRNGILLIFDEVQSAIRTGYWLASEQYGVMPDIACLSKSFSYGLPFGFVITKKEIGDMMTKGGHGGTFNGNPLVCTAAIEIIRKIKKDNLLKNAQELGEYFLSELQKTEHPSIVKIKGKGLMIGIEFSEKITPYVKKMQDAGLIAALSSTDTIRFLPPINVTKTEIDEALTIIKRVFA